MAVNALASYQKHSILKRLCLIAITKLLTFIDLVTAINEKKPSGHPHLFLARQLEPTLVLWSTFFPFLMKAKGSDYPDVWLDESDLPGMVRK